MLTTQPSIPVHVLLLVNRMQNRKAYLLDKACFSCSNTVKTRKKNNNLKYSPPKCGLAFVEEIPFLTALEVLTECVEVIWY